MTTIADGNIDTGEDKHKYSNIARIGCNPDSDILKRFPDRHDY